MIGLIHGARDLCLPAELGDERLLPPSEKDMVELVNGRLCVCEGKSSPVTCTTEARLVDVRYRPSVATSATYAVRDIHGVEHLVTYKVHLGGRAENRVVGGRYGDRVRKVCDPLLPYALLPERMASLWVFPADPELRGAVRALNSARTASWIWSLGLIGDRAPSSRGGSVSLEGYEHSRRAVYRVGIDSMGEAGDVSLREFGLRILPVECAAQSAAMRAQLPALDLPVPRLVGHDAANGWLLEEWTAGVPAEDGDVSVGALALACAAQIHGAPLAPGGPSGQPGPRRRLAPMDLLNGIPGIHRVPDWLWRPLEIPATAWIHGDLHPGRVLIREGGAGLLGLDGLRPGAPEEDIASWAADVLARGHTADVEAVLGELEELYSGAGGAPLDPGRLRAVTAIELLERAASAIRHLEADALLSAARLASIVASI